LASSRDSSNTPDWKDLAEILNSFQNQNKLTVEVTILPVVTGTTCDLSLSLRWGDVGAGREDWPHQNLLRATCLGTNRKGLESAILALLYQLDFKLALTEYDGIVKKV